MERREHPTPLPPGEIKCPACGVVPKACHFPPVQVSVDMKIKSPLTNEMMSLDDAIIEYINHYFPSLQHLTYRVPAALFYEARGDLDLWTNSDLVSNTELSSSSKGAIKISPLKVVDSRFQKDAVEAIVSILYSWGIQNKQVMFILSEYKFSDYCKLTKAVKPTKLTGEHDIVIFHRRLGILLIEVKSVSSDKAFKTKRSKIKGAWEQVLRNEIAFRDMNSGLGFVRDIPFYYFIAFPNLTSRDLQAVKVCDDHKKHILYKDNIVSVENVNAVLGSYFGDSLLQNDSNDAMTSMQYEQLCARYAGFASVVHVRTIVDAVSKINSKMNIANMSNEKMEKIFLNPEQLALIKMQHLRKIILTGEYGTGKSIVLKMLADKLCENNSNYLIFIVSCTNVSHTRTMGRLRKSKNHLVEHIRHLTKNADTENILIWSISDLVGHCFPTKDVFSQRLSPRLICDIANYLIDKYPDRQVALLLDEVPFVPSWNWSILETFCLRNAELYLWMTIATGTYAIRDDTDPLSVVKSNSPRGFPVLHLKRCMRMTRNSLRFYKALQEHLGDKAHLFMEYGNAIEGPIPLWYELPYCKCKSSNPFACTCIDSRMDQTIHAVFNQLVDVKPNHVTFVIRDSVQDTDQFLSSLLVRSCKRINIPLRSFLQTSVANQSSANADDLLSYEHDCPKLVDIFSFKGCESPVVIFITPFGWPLVWEHNQDRHGWDDISQQISRALGQIILITWPKNEMDYFSLQAIKVTMESYSQKRYDESDTHEKEIEKAMESNFQKVIETYEQKDREVYLNSLVERGVLVKFPIVASSDSDSNVTKF
ncbi:uncharacterized protein LOC117103874 [Anneissia japonica]|uniref:uncharacterized protein LOC117103874 n=1 Tax=Anneissia japonica TaxID=1529436 RepID=UPI0014259EC2|nr:uncharacterized protein LOC117103874 [Anneissia japonica]